MSERQALLRDLEKYSEAADTIGRRVDAWAKAKVIDEMPSDDEAAELRDALQRATDLAIELRGMLEIAAEIPPTDWH